MEGWFDIAMLNFLKLITIYLPTYALICMKCILFGSKWTWYATYSHMVQKKMCVLEWWEKEREGEGERETGRERDREREW